MTDVCEIAILRCLAETEDAVIDDSFPWSVAEKLDYNAVSGAIKSLLADDYVVAENLSTGVYSLSAEGGSILANGSPEAVVLKAVEEAGKLSLIELRAKVGKDVARLGTQHCMKKNWIIMDGGNLVPIQKFDSIEDDVKHLLQKLVDENFALDTITDKDARDLKHRKLIKLVTRKSHKVTRGSSFASHRVKKCSIFTKEMLDSETWKTAEFKPYNFKALGKAVGGGYLHPLLQVRAEFRKILLTMGFNEMPTNKWVESSFWNFYSIFLRGLRPAPDAFFINDPVVTIRVPKDYFERVKAMHETSGCGSTGYGFKREEAMKNVLRTHLKAISAQMLYKLTNQPEGFKPAKYFSIDRVFRNDDITPLCELHQLEVLVADYDLSLGDLMGTIETFCKKIGIPQLRFKPTFDPYTRPSVEIMGYHPDLKRWIWLGNAGMFHPEMLQSIGLPENVRAIAWSMSVERPTMIKSGIKTIRDLVGYKVDLGRTRTVPICRFMSNGEASE